VKKTSSLLVLGWAIVFMAPVALAAVEGTNTPAAGEVKETAAAVPDSAAAIPDTATPTNAPPLKTEFELKIEVAKEQHRQKDLDGAAQTLEDILKTNAPTEMQRQALYELALVNEDDNQTIRAQQILAQYLHLYPEDPSIPDVLLRQGLLYRVMGVNTLAISKFYAVMSSALKLKLNDVDYYKKLVVRAQTEIADTFFLEAKFEQAAEFYNRILKAGDAEGNRELLECKLIRSLSYLTNQMQNVDAVGQAQTFLGQFPKSVFVPEVRFLLASALKNLGRNQDSMKQVLMLLQSQQENVNKDPGTWIYWQRRAGNEIANQLYKEGDYLDALELYLSLADLDKSPAWQVPVWYQAGMVYEQLQQWQKATDIYTQIMGRQPELNATNTSPMLDSLMDMARWRKDYIAWAQKARVSIVALQTPAPPNPTVAAPR
jgi:tetratricopeptide (TPR) repeat protein